MSEKEVVHIQARIPKDTRDSFRKIAESKAQNPSALIRMWIEKYIEENKNSN